MYTCKIKLRVGKRPTNLQNVCWKYPQMVFQRIIFQNIFPVGGGWPPLPYSPWQMRIVHHNHLLRGKFFRDTLAAYFLDETCYLACVAGGISCASAFVLVAKPSTRVVKPWGDWWRVELNSRLPKFIGFFELCVHQCTRISDWLRALKHQSNVNRYHSSIPRDKRLCLCTDLPNGECGVKHKENFGFTKFCTVGKSWRCCPQVLEKAWFTRYICFGEPKHAISEDLRPVYLSSNPAVYWRPNCRNRITKLHVCGRGKRQNRVHMSG